MSSTHRGRALFGAGALALAVLAGGVTGAAIAAGDDEVVVYKDPNCGCCGAWADHMRKSGFRVTEIKTSEMDAVKRKAGVPQAAASCHTAKVGGYIVEGHVPAADVKRLLAEKPKVTGIAAPGMPMGSPGMEGPYPADRYDVVTFDEKGPTGVFARH